MDRLDAYVCILQRLGTHISQRTTMLDFGCGDGELVRSAALRGIDAYGCDIDFSQVWIDEDLLASLLAENRVRKIEASKRENPHLSPVASDLYRLPFDDSTFDVVISDQVLEHVSNFTEVVHELYRVMKPGGVFLHMFPPKFSLIEAHTNLPLSGAFNPDWWLRLWANIGIRNEFQRNLSAKETFTWNRTFLDTCVNYLTKSQLEKAFVDSFDVKFVEGEFFKVSKRTRVFLHPTLYGCFRGRVMYGVRRSNCRA
jgi:SAM-dependent methyltransferase